MSGPEEVPEGLVESGIRLAFRAEGAQIVAYLAKRETMDGAMVIGTVTREGLRGADSEGFRLWREAMAHIFADLVEDLAGIRPVIGEPQSGPEHERSGHA